MSDADDSQADALFEEDDLPPAKFMFMGKGENGQPKWFSFPCPGAEGRKHPGARCMVPLSPQRNGNGATWTWNGDRERPTLSPSINCHGCWHGFIRDGEITPDVDGRP